MIKVIAIVVTYNRLALLQEAIAAVQGQAFKTAELLVVNNGSTDGTAAWLEQQDKLQVIHQKNIGGSGGFYTGLKYAATNGFDFAWVMDDDTIPESLTLEILVKKLEVLSEPVGFIGSKCEWTDGTPHLMNIPAIGPSFNQKIPFNRYDKDNLLLVETSSFVSILININAVKEVGLPYRDFFIWGDDQEYTRRITKAGYLGLYCADSLVLHKTPTNYFPDFYRDTPNNLWKHKHGFRNEFFMVKKNRGTAYFLPWLVLKLGYTSYKLMRIRRHDHGKFLRALWNSGWQSIFFNPKIDKI